MPQIGYVSEWAHGHGHVALGTWSCCLRLPGAAEEKLVAGVPPELPGTGNYTYFPTFLRSQLQLPSELLDDHCPDSYSTFDIRMGQKLLQPLPCRSQQDGLPGEGTCHQDY